jgi:LPS-assembly protein
MYLRLFILLCVVSFAARSAHAQDTPAPATPPAPVAPAQAAPAAPAPAGQVLDQCKAAFAWTSEQVGTDLLRYTGQAELECGTTRFFADQIDVHTDTNVLEASGNVVFAGPEGRISAERVEFNLARQVGTFYQASGSMSLGPGADRAPFGGQEPDVLFYGEKIEKVGDRSYKVTRGGFTTCVQPTPRWEVASDSVTLNLNEYAIARNMVLRVKGVPVMYLPLIYYPIQDDERATGFLLPTYGTSTNRGQAISNAFFWAINRSQDATFFHDWFTRAGQGVGSEYRYIAGAGSQGNFRVYRFGRKETEFNENGATTIVPASNSFEIAANATQQFGRSTRGRLRIEYFSHLLTQQLYYQNVYQATRRSRVIDGGISSSLGPLAMSAQFQRTESFNDERRSTTYGGTPRLSASLAPQHLGGPFYASLTSDYAFLPYQELTDGIVTRDRSLARTDIAPTLRVPMSKLTYLSVNSSASYRSTYYSKRADITNSSGDLVPEGFLRQYLALRSEVVGPVFTRIWDTPDSGFAERLKHVIEPTFTVDHTTNIERAQQTPVLTDISDFVVSGATRFTYGVNNRLFYRGRTVDGVRGQTREFVTVGLQQTFYSNPLSSQFDTTYASASTSRRAVDLSPVALNVRVSPSTVFDTTTRLEYDVNGGGLQVLTLGSNVNGGRTSAGVNFSRRHVVKTQKPDDYLSAQTSLRLLDGRVTGTYGLSWNIAQSYVVSQTGALSYMAQCCGFQAEFQRFNFPSSYGIPDDRRINFSFVLAGLGTFSNFFGAFGGTAR